MAKENYSISQVKALIALCDGEVVRRVAFKGVLGRKLEDSGLIVVSKQGKSYLFTAISRVKMKAYVQRLLDVEDIREYLRLLQKKAAGENVSRSEASKGANGSKRLVDGVMRGFKVNVIGELALVYDGQSIILRAERGMCVEVQDWRKIRVADNVTVVGVENYETFMYIKDYAYLFKGVGSCLFVFRDTVTPGAYERVKDFLLGILNPYLHFGDLDLGGVNIYLNEYRRFLGERASFLIPDGYEEMLRHGDNALYIEQADLRPDVSLDVAVAPLVYAIRGCKAVVEQERLSVSFSRSEGRG